MSTFSNRFKELRKQKEINQKELAKILEVSQAQISMWENGINEPTVTNIIKICDYFNVCADYLIGRQDWY